MIGLCYLKGGKHGSKGVTRGVKGVTILEGVTRGVTVIDLVKDLGLDLGKDLGLTGWNAEGGLNGQEEGWKEEGLQVRGDCQLPPAEAGGLQKVN